MNAFPNEDSYQDRPNIGGNGNGMNVDVNDNQARKRAMQAAYALELQQQLLHKGDNRDNKLSVAGGRHNNNNNAPTESSGTGLALGVPVDDRALRRQKQEEYARALEEQLHWSPNKKQPSQQQPDPRRDFYQRYADPELDHADGRGAAIGSLSSIGGGGDLDKQAKRTKQAEYAKALEQQLNNKMQSNNQKQNLNGGRHPAAAGGPGSAIDSQGALGEGWVIGPLGMPVRKTLDVGNRRLQKVFNQDSPPKNQAPYNDAMSSNVSAQDPAHYYREGGDRMGYPPPHAEAFSNHSYGGESDYGGMPPVRGGAGLAVGGRRGAVPEEDLQLLGADVSRLADVESERKERAKQRQV